MCPFTKVWQDKIYCITKQIVDDLQVRAIYLDQVSGAPIKLCYDKDHGHPLGGGDWWVKSYHEMLAKLKTIKGYDGNPVAITTEFAAEPYAGATDAFLVWMAQAPEDIPMLPMVYSGYALYFGSNNYSTDESTWKLIQLRSTIWGIQNGWMAPEFILDPQNKFRIETMKNIAAIRKQAQKYLTCGELMDIIDSSDTIDLLWDAKNVKFPAMQAAIWKYGESSIAVLIANYSSSKRQFDLQITLGKYGIIKQSDCSKSGIDDNSCTIQNGIINIQKTIESGSIGFLELPFGKNGAPQKL
jgi:hypothetical protein